MSDNSYRVFWGGSWNYSAQEAGVADCIRYGPADRLINLGFRLVHETDTPQVLRGGSWFYSERAVGAANWDAVKPGDGYDILGFRLAKEST